MRFSFIASRRSVTKNQITNFKLIAVIFVVDRIQKREEARLFLLFFRFTKTTKIKTKKFGILFLVTGRCNEKNIGLEIRNVFYLSIRLRRTSYFKLDQAVKRAIIIYKEILCN